MEVGYIFLRTLADGDLSPVTVMSGNKQTVLFMPNDDPEKATTAAQNIADAYGETVRARRLTHSPRPDIVAIPQVEKHVVTLPPLNKKGPSDV